MKNAWTIEYTRIFLLVLAALIIGLTTKQWIFAILHEMERFLLKLKAGFSFIDHQSPLICERFKNPQSKNLYRT